MADFFDRGGTFPAEPTALVNYLAHRADDLAPATLTRRLIAIAQAHTIRGLPNPCRSDIVRLTLRGIRRIHGRPQRQARPFLKAHLAAVTKTLGSSIRDRRDRAVLAIGFYGALRRSELVGIETGAIRFLADGLSVTIPRSKTDQEGKGRRIFIQKLSAADCPVQMLEEWLEASKIGGGSIFRSVDRFGRIGTRALSPEAVNIILTERLEVAGFASEGFSGHSLRAGFVTEAINIGWPLWKFVSRPATQVTRHSSVTFGESK